MSFGNVTPNPPIDWQMFRILIYNIFECQKDVFEETFINFLCIIFYTYSGVLMPIANVHVANSFFLKPNIAYAYKYYIL